MLKVQKTAPTESFGTRLGRIVDRVGDALMRPMRESEAQQARHDAVAADVFAADAYVRHVTPRRTLSEHHFRAGYKEVERVMLGDHRQRRAHAELDHALREYRRAHGRSEMSDFERVIARVKADSEALERSSWR